VYRDNVTFTKGLMTEQHFPFTKGLPFKISAVEFLASAFQSNVRNGVMKICSLNLAGARLKGMRCAPYRVPKVVVSGIVHCSIIAIRRVNIR